MGWSIVRTPRDRAGIEVKVGDYLVVKREGMKPWRGQVVLLRPNEVELLDTMGKRRQARPSECEVLRR